MRNRAVLAALLLWPLAGGCGQSEGESVDVDGSSTVGPISMAVAEEFKKVDPSVQLNIGISGTGGGFKKFIQGMTQVSDASRPIKAKEAAECKKKSIAFIELPIAYDGIAVVTSKENTWCDSLTVAELKAIFKANSRLTLWSEVREGFPDVPLQLYAPGRDSGTFDYFTKKINGKEGSGRAKGITASEDDNVLVTGISSRKGGLGYFGYAYYQSNQDKLNLLGIVAADGQPAIAPSPETVENGSYKPLSRPIFIYVRKDAYETRPGVKKFVDFYLAQVKGLVESVGYMPLPDAVYELCLKRLADGTTGSAYADPAAVKGKSLLEIYTR